MKNLTSSDITKLAKIILRNRGVYAWRHNQLAVKGRKFIGEPGCSDLIGYHIVAGTFAACEVKAKGDVLSEDQKAFLKKVEDAGGIALIAFEDRSGNVSVVNWEAYLKM